MAKKVKVEELAIDVSGSVKGLGRRRICPTLAMFGVVRISTSSNLGVPLEFISNNLKMGLYARIVALRFRDELQQFRLGVAFHRSSNDAKALIDGGKIGLVSPSVPRAREELFRAVGVINKVFSETPYSLLIFAQLPSAYIYDLVFRDEVSVAYRGRIRSVRLHPWRTVLPLGEPTVPSYGESIYYISSSSPSETNIFVNLDKKSVGEMGQIPRASVISLLQYDGYVTTFIYFANVNSWRYLLMQGYNRIAPAAEAPALPPLVADAGGGNHGGKGS